VWLKSVSGLRVVRTRECSGGVMGRLGQRSCEGRIKSLRDFVTLVKCTFKRVNKWS
jgi:hypothetical protein